MNKTDTQPLLLPAEHLYRGLALNPQAIAAEDPREKISYRELVCRSEALAMALQAHLPPGSHIGLCAQNHIDHLVAHLAIVIGGFVWVPINPKNGAQLNQQLIQKSCLSLLLIDRQSLDKVSANDLEQWLLDDGSSDDCRHRMAAFRDAAFTPVIPDGSATMCIKFTGGTSGEPKGVVQTHNNVAAVIANMQAIFEFDHEDANLAVAPLTHGGSHYIFPILGTGGRHLLLPSPDPEQIQKAFTDDGASVSFMPPTLIYKLLDQPGITAQDFPKLRHLTYSAAPMPPEKIHQVIETIGPRLSTVYGQTEAPMTITAMNAADMQNKQLQSSVGKACRLSDVAILDNQGNFVKTGETGEVATCGQIVMPGYFEEPDKTRETFSNDWLLTGDLGYLDSNGYLFLQGRSKELIISGGFNVYPAEVENALMQLPEIKECSVFGVEDAYWGERVEAAVCLTDQNLIESDVIRTQLKAVLGDVKTPKKIYFLDALPRNPVGKVVRREVKALCCEEKNF
ncbi:MAG: AMP-binding protein [Candidatus Pelagadaptatus aseana]|uniref:class I adenylate-forming enzyme family protein n=1 Tax=Candidatus Pelagadaptatus aseana TaxID=3120508 RepID=UPI0039B24057